MKSSVYAIKTEVSDSLGATFAFHAQKTMYGGKHIARGDTLFVFASENEEGQGLIASGVVTSTKAISKETWNCSTNAACERQHESQCARKAAPGAKGAQTFFRLERRST